MRGVEVGSIGLPGENDVTLLSLLAIGIGIVKIIHSIEPGNTQALRRGHPVIRVQGLFKAQRRLAGVANHQLLR